jgi:hypothetical protein
VIQTVPSGIFSGAAAFLMLKYVQSLTAGRPYWLGSVATSGIAASSAAFGFCSMTVSSGFYRYVFKCLVDPVPGAPSCGHELAHLQNLPFYAGVMIKDLTMVAMIITHVRFSLCLFWVFQSSGVFDFRHAGL